MIETGTRCTVETRFQICSVSKQFTAAAVMLLVVILVNEEAVSITGLLRQLLPAALES